MFWADKIALDIKNRQLPLEWVDDMKTPSGKIHVGALRGVVIHDLMFKTLKDAGVNTKYTYIYDNHDPMDALPVYLPKEKFENYMGSPLFTIPSPEAGYKNYAEYYAKDFTNVFTAIGCTPEILWTTDIYMSGKLNPMIKDALDNTDTIKGIYEELYDKPLAKDWYPFQVYCEKCGKVSTTKVSNWDGEKVTYTCDIDRLDWARGCGHHGKVSPFSDKDHIAGKLPWKIEWGAKWKALGITVEGAGKDHMSKGGSHDLATLVCNKVFHYPVPFPLPYEFFLVGGKKMSSSKGLGSSAAEMLAILPPELLRFLMVRPRLNQTINFDPAGDTIPNLFDEYQKAAEAYQTQSDPDLGRIFVLSQVGKDIKLPPKIRFSVLAQWVQMPNMKETIEKEGLSEWATYAQIWVDRFAPESEKFTIKEEVPSEVHNLSNEQKDYLKTVGEMLKNDWDPEDFQVEMYEAAKIKNISGKEAFSAIYTALLGKTYGPKAAWLILSLDKNFVINRFNLKDKTKEKNSTDNTETKESKSSISPDIFLIANDVKKAYPSISIGIGILENVTIAETNEELEKEKEALLKTLEHITNEEINSFPEVISYRKLYKEMGIDYHSRRPSPEALLRRIALKKGLYSINTCVDAYNLIVMKHKVSIGAFDLDTIHFPTELRFPHEGEEILLLGDEKPTAYKEKEISYFDQKGGYNLDFNYRDAKRTCVTNTTKNLYINVDGVFDITPKQVEDSLNEAIAIIQKYCSGKLKFSGVIGG